MFRLLFSVCLLFASGSAVRGETRLPNFVIIFADDQGYGDLGCFGSETIATPHIDRMAAEGRRLTNFMVASPVCTPSRAALLTGSYPKRVGLHQHVLFPQSTKGLHPEEHTIADHLKAAGYATGCFGKWHLGHHPETLPRQNGFDVYFGIPYSNDMNHPDNKRKPRISSDNLWKDQESAVKYWNTPLIENEEIVELPVDQRTITRRYTDRAIDFIEQHQDQPFFVYLPHSMPHIPLYVPENAYDSDPQNAYKCVIEHIDAEVGRLMDTIRELDLAEDTIVIYTSDNGPWLQFKNHGGSAGPLRAGKGTTFEGGQRVPCVVWGPGRVPAGTECSELVATIDLLPSIASLIDRPLPEDRQIDGQDMSSCLVSETCQNPREEYLYYTSHGQIEGIRQGKWKLLVKYPRRRGNRARGEKVAPEVLLFDLDRDVGEANNLADEHPQLVQSLQQRMLQRDAEIEAAARAPWTK
ncbi:sulfatase family protein [Roseimaritima sediminicola]|uniref:sulfatase family protein n=1 Tax=Roseimaritima sediminicola TaxID=2662066 RepID=UPI0012983C07|nr:sulfatase [Roseimaritima sediminicola]